MSLSTAFCASVLLFSFLLHKTVVPGAAFLKELRRNLFFVRDICVKIYSLWTFGEQCVISLALGDTTKPALTLTTDTSMIGELTHVSPRIEKLVFLARYSFSTLYLFLNHSVLQCFCVFYLCMWRVACTTMSEWPLPAFLSILHWKCGTKCRQIAGKFASIRAHFLHFFREFFSHISFWEFVLS